MKRSLAELRPVWVDMLPLICRQSKMPEAHLQELRRCAAAADALNALLRSGLLSEAAMQFIAKELSK